jgi:hypothetical protein
MASEAARLRKIEKDRKRPRKTCRTRIRYGDVYCITCRGLIPLGKSGFRIVCTRRVCEVMRRTEQSRVFSDRMRAAGYVHRHFGWERRI